MGQHLSEAKAETLAAKSAGEIAVMESRIGEAKAYLKAASARIAQLAEANAAWQSTHQATLNELAQQRQEIVVLSTAAGKADNCAFIHDQIRTINVQLHSTGSGMIFSDSDDWRQKQSERRSALQTQLARAGRPLGSDVGPLKNGELD